MAPEFLKKHYDAKITLTNTYKVSVYATKAGYDNSDIVTREINLDNCSAFNGDTNKDGKVDAADVVTLVNIIMENGGTDTP